MILILMTALPQLVEEEKLNRKILENLARVSLKDEN
jgi:hypothetical protein